MSEAVALNVTNARVAGTVVVTGAPATTAYVISVTDADGSVTRYDVTTSGGGGATVAYTPMLPGSISVAVRPLGPPANTSTTTGTALAFN